MREFTTEEVRDALVEYAEALDGHGPRPRFTLQLELRKRGYVLDDQLTPEGRAVLDRLRTPAP